MKGIFLIVLSLFHFQIFTQGYYVDNYAIHIDITQNAQLQITEIIDVEFTEKRRGIILSIPLQYKIQGKNHTINISNVEVEEYKFKSFKKRKTHTIRIGSADTYITGPHTYVVRYDVEKAITHYPEYMELYWNLIGSKWDTPIAQANFTIDLPDNIRIDTNRIHIEQASVELPYTFINNQIKASTTQTTHPGEAITVGIAFEKEAFGLSQEIDSDETVSSYTPLKDYALPIPMLLLTSLLWFWNRNGRTKNYEGKAEDIFYPPVDLSPAEIGTYIDHQSHTRDILALLPYWAYRKLIYIEQNKDDIYLGKLNSMPDDYPYYQRYMFDTLFEKEDLIRMSSMKRSMHSILGTTKKHIHSEIRNLKVYDTKATQIFNGKPMITLSILSIIATIGSLFIFKWILTAVSFAIIGIAGIIIYNLRPKLNTKGQIMLDQIHNFKTTIEHLDDKSTHKLHTEDPSYFDKIYPYAVAFGIDKQLTKKFERLMDDAPSWYTQPNSAGPVGFGTFQQDFQTQKIKNMFTPDLSDSGGGGYSGGGGFSGGGMGGSSGSSW